MSRDYMMYLGMVDETVHRLQQMGGLNQSSRKDTAHLLDVAVTLVRDMKALGIEVVEPVPREEEVMDAPTTGAADAGTQ